MDAKSFVPKIEPGRYAREFREFLLKTNMFALAMGVVIGAAVGKVVTGIVSDLVMPIVGIITPEGDWRTWEPKLSGHLGPLDFSKLHLKLGDLAGNLLDFVIISTVVFMITKAFVKQQPPPPTKVCSACREGNHPEATRCKFCTSSLAPAAPATPAA